MSTSPETCRARFDRLATTYGSLWRSLASDLPDERTITTITTNNININNNNNFILKSIETGQPVQGFANCGKNCWASCACETNEVIDCDDSIEIISISSSSSISQNDSESVISVDSDSDSDSDPSFDFDNTEKDKNIDKENNRLDTNTITNTNPRSKQKLTQTQWRKNRDGLLKAYFEMYNSEVFDNSLSAVDVGWNKKLLTTAGHAKLRRQDGKRTVFIELSEKVIDQEHRLKTTLLHEMCHAAAWLLDASNKPAHGPVFKKWANRAMDKTDVIVTTKHSYEISYKHAWACQSSFCGAVIKRQSRSVDPTKHVCSACKGKLVEIETDDLESRTPKKTKPLNDYAQYVKDNSAKVRKILQRRPVAEGGGKQVSFGDVTKELARRYKLDKDKKEQTRAVVGNLGNLLKDLTFN